MTATAQRYFLFRLNRNKARNIITAIFALAGLPLGAGFMCYMSGLEKHMDDNLHTVSNNTQWLTFVFSAVAIVSICALVIVAFVNAYTSFDWLLERSTVDTMHALPIKRSQMFWADFFAGLIPPLAAAILSSVLAVIIIAIFGGDIVWGAIIQLLAAYVITVALTYILSVFVASICGKTASAVLYTIAACVVIPAVLAVLADLFFVKTPEIEVTGSLWQLIAASSPAGFAVSALLSSVGVAGFDMPVNWTVFGSPFVMIGIVLVAAAELFFARKIVIARSAENIGRPFAVRGAYSAFVAGINFFTLGVFMFSIIDQPYGGHSPGAVKSTIVAAVITLVFMNFIIEIITHLSLKGIGKAGIRLVASGTATAVICLLVSNLNAFGTGEYIPAKIDSIAIDGRYDPDFDYGWLIGGMYLNGRLIKKSPVFTEEANIKAFREIIEESYSKHILREIRFGKVSYDELTERSYFGGTVEVLYNGNTRRIVGLSKDLRDKLAALCETDEYIRGYVAYLDKVFDLPREETRYNDSPYGKTTTTYKFGVIEVTPPGITYNLHDGEKSHEAGDAEIIFEAYKKDLLENGFGKGYLLGTVNIEVVETRYSTQDRYGPSSWNEITTIPLFPNMTNTLAAIEKIGLRIPSTMELDDLKIVCNTLITVGEGYEQYVSRDTELLISKERLQQPDIQEVLNHLEYRKSSYDGEYTYFMYGIGNWYTIIPREYDYILAKLFDEAGIKFDDPQ